jgi:hypothetical protein
MKQKHPAVIFIMFLLMLSSVIHSCTKEDTYVTRKFVFLDTKSNQSFNLENQTDLNSLAKILSKESGDVKILKNARITELSDSKGAYEALVVRYEVDGIMVSMTVPIIQISADEFSFHSARESKNEVFYTRQAESCEMKCTASNCDICTQTVIERCKSQSCACSGFSSGCDASIIFSD